MKRISYSKEFLTGNLAGTSVHCSFMSDSPEVVLALLAKKTKQNPGIEHGTGAAYWVYNIGCEDAADIARDEAAKAGGR